MKTTSFEETVALSLLGIAAVVGVVSCAMFVFFAAKTIEIREMMQMRELARIERTA